MKSTAIKFLLSFLLPISLIAQPSHNKMVVGYYAQWAIYARDYNVSDIDGSKLTHLMYAFMGTTYDAANPANTKLRSLDTHADFLHSEDMPPYEAPYKGNFYGMKKLKERYPHLKIIISVGGWTRGQDLPAIAASSVAREALANDMVKYMTDYPFIDGFDIDWEFPVVGGTDGTEHINWAPIPAQPHTVNDHINFVRLVKTMREKFPEGKLVTIAAGNNVNQIAQQYIGPNNRELYGLTDDLTTYCDFIMFFGYDLSGPWDDKTGYNAPLYASNNPNAPNPTFSVAALVDAYLNDIGIPADKLVPGVPFYGKLYGNLEGEGSVPGLPGLFVNAPRNTNAGCTNPIPERGTWDEITCEFSGAIEFTDLAGNAGTNPHHFLSPGVPDQLLQSAIDAGWTRYWDNTCKVPYLYNASLKQFISYDDKQSLTEKIDYFNSKNIGGVMIWELSQDARESVPNILLSHIDATLTSEPITITVTLKTPTDGPIENISLDLKNSSGTTVQTKQTSATGVVEFTEVPSNRPYSITYSSTNYKFLPSEITILSNEVLTDATYSIVGSEQVVSISGVVKEGGNNFVDVDILLKDTDGKLLKKIHSTDGTFTLSDVLQGLTYKLTAEKTYFDFSELTFTNLTTNQTNLELTASLKKFFVRGTVRDGLNPISGVTITASGAGETHTATTGTDGVYSIGNLKAGSNYVLSASKPDKSFLPSSATFNKIDNDKTLNFKLNANLISGFVKDGSNPVSGAKVSLIFNWVDDSHPYIKHTTYTDSDGLYKFDNDKVSGYRTITHLKLETWENNGVQYYPTTYSDVSVPKTPQKFNFNAKKVTPEIKYLTPSESSVSVAPGTAISFTANAGLTFDDGETTLQSVVFEVDGKTVTATKDGNIYKASWTPEITDFDKEIFVKAIAKDSKNDEAYDTHKFKLNCSGTSCPNKLPIITWKAPEKTRINQADNFEPIDITVSVTDDGSVNSVTISIDGATAVNMTVGTANQYTYQFTPFAYKDYSIIIKATDNMNGERELKKTISILNSSFTPLPDHVVVGYVHSWANPEAPFLKLRDISDKYNVLVYAFIETVENKGVIPLLRINESAYQTNGVFDKQLLIDDIAFKKSQGIPVLVSIGGEKGHVELNTEEQKNIFIEGLKSIIDEYGFDGVDIDFEGRSMRFDATSLTDFSYESISQYPKLKNVVDAFVHLDDYYGDGFIITAAPEVAYVQTGFSTFTATTGSFLPVIEYLGERLDLLMVQLYNTGSQNALDRQIYEQATPDFIVSMTDMLLSGFNTSTNIPFTALPASRVVVGIPACAAKAAPAGGYLQPTEAIKALDYLRLGTTYSGRKYTLQSGTHPGLRGVMTWSANWDAANTCSTVYEFANAYSEYFNTSVVENDDDRDGVPNSKDICDNTPTSEQADIKGCSPSQKDSDKDGVNDKLDKCPNTAEGAIVDADGCPENSGGGTDPIDELISNNEWENEIFPKRWGYDPTSGTRTKDFYTFTAFKAAIKRIGNIEVLIERRCGTNQSKITRIDVATNTSKVISISPNFNAPYNQTKPIVKERVVYSEFLNHGDITTRKRELAAFLSNISHETTGGPATGNDYTWGLYWKEEGENQPSIPPNDYVSPSTEYPAVSGKSYHGRGPIQLSYNYNYGPASEYLFGDKNILLSEPEKVSTDPIISFMSAIWFWMTPQTPKPSSHDVITGNWTPTDSDVTKNRAPGLGMTINIINGGVECGSGGDEKEQVVDRIEYYKRYVSLLDITSEVNGQDNCNACGCADMANYANDNVGSENCISVVELKIIRPVSGTLIRHANALIPVDVEVAYTTLDKPSSDFNVTIDDAEFTSNTFSWTPKFYKAYAIEASVKIDAILYEKESNITIYQDVNNIDCAGIEEWTPGKDYTTGGLYVKRNSKIYETRHWTNQDPEGSDQWLLFGNCLSNSAPTVSISTTNSGAEFTISAQAADADNGLYFIDLLVDGKKIESYNPRSTSNELISSANKDFIYTTSLPKNYNVQVIAYDKHGYSATASTTIEGVAPCGIPGWYPDVAYYPPSEGQAYVVYDSKIYKNKSYIGVNENPPNNHLSWELVANSCADLKSIPITDKCHLGKDWDSEVDNYYENDYVLFNNGMYQAKTWLLGTDRPDHYGQYNFVGICVSRPAIDTDYKNKVVVLQPEGLKNEAITANIESFGFTPLTVVFKIKKSSDAEFTTHTMSEGLENEYLYNWTPPNYGVYEFAIKATNNAGLTEEVSGTMNVAKTNPPIIKNIDPESSSSFTQLAFTAIDISFNVQRNGNVVRTIKVYDRTANSSADITVNATENYNWEWTPTQYGKNLLEIIATNQDGDEEVAKFEYTIKDPLKEQLSFTDPSLYQIVATSTITKEFIFDKAISNVLKRDPSLATVTFSGNKLTVDSNKVGRSGLKITTTDGKVYYIGLRVDHADGTVAGLPDYVSIGSVSEDVTWDIAFWEDINNDNLLKNKRMDIRYIYVNGGANTGWPIDNPKRIVNYVKYSLKFGLIPTFIYYQIPDGNESPDTNKTSVQNPDYMTKYFENINLFIDDVKKEIGDELFVVLLEPDFLSYTQQGLETPSMVTAVSETQIATGVGTLKTLVTRINKTFDTRRREDKLNMLYGWQLNLWGKPGASTQGIIRETDTGDFDDKVAMVREFATSTTQYGIDVGILTHNPDFISIDKYGLDAAGSPAKTTDANLETNPGGYTWFWNNDHWNNYLEFVKTMHQVSNKHIVLWQIPVGHINSTHTISAYTDATYPDLPNTDKKYEDSATTFFFGDKFTVSTDQRFSYFTQNRHNDSKLMATPGDRTITYGNHIEEVQEAGVRIILGGAGVGISTDGVGSPPSDDYFWIQKVQDYYLNKLVDLKDTDEDGVNDFDDLCPNTPASATIDKNGCAESQKDDDKDGVKNDVDQCKNTPEDEDVDQNGCSASQKDDDGDSVNNLEDECPNTPDGEQIDSNGCSEGQKDSDGDGVKNSVDKCPDTPKDEQANAEGCSISQINAQDADGDGVKNGSDLCPNTPKESQVDINGCAASQKDDDNDNVTNDKDLCSGTPANSTVNASGCAQSQLDDDGDDVFNDKDQCANTPVDVPVNTVGCAQSQLDDDGDKVFNDKDKCPNTPIGATVNTLGCAQSQLDDDGDKVFNDKDQCANTPSGASVNAAGCAQSQLDDDQDGVFNDKDQCANTPSSASVNNVGCAQSQLDDDGDKVYNDKDQCANTPSSASVNNVGCAQSQLDDDGDKVYNDKDQCANTPRDATVNASGCAQSQLDDDGDKVFNDKDDCSNTPSGEAVNTFGCSQSQLDDDGDKVFNDKDECPNTPSSATVNTSGCAPSQLDSDNDGVKDDKDLCPGTASGSAVNTSGCSTEQLNSGDDDNDGVKNAYDLCPGTAAGESVDAHGCSQKQIGEKDDDGDGIKNAQDLCPNTPSGKTVNTSGCAQSQLDDDGDKVFNDKDQCANTPTGESVNSVGCAQSQLDDDGDKVFNNKDQCPNTPSRASVNNVGCAQSQLDDDGDKIFNDKDQCANTPPDVTVNASGCAQSQLDDDQDGVSNDKDKCANTPSNASVNNDGCAQSQLDEDRDGVFNDKDDCSNTLEGAKVDINGCAQYQLDDDHDGVSNDKDECPNTLSGSTVNTSGCAPSQLDDDGDGVHNDKDECKHTPSGAIVSANGCSFEENDEDGDGVANSKDQCKNTPSGETVDNVGCAKSQKDEDGDSVTDDRDFCPNTPPGASVLPSGCSNYQLRSGDDDNDGAFNAYDKCPNSPLNESVNLYGCTISQQGMLDDDKDGVINSKDECPETAQGEEVNVNGCSTNQFNERDDDGDGIKNATDECPETISGESVDIRGCSLRQIGTQDKDEDGIANATDKCPDTPKGKTVNAFGCSNDQFALLDDDRDGIYNLNDECPGTKLGIPVDINGCTKGQLIQKFGDSDFDGIINTLDMCPDTPNGEIVNSDGCSRSQIIQKEGDADGDGVTDLYDVCPDTPSGASIDEKGCAETQKDDDKDGVNNDKDLCPRTARDEKVDANGCSIYQNDLDRDGVDDDLDECPWTSSGDAVDEKGCSERQKDHDGDSINNADDLCPNTPEGSFVYSNGCSEAEVASGDYDSDGVPNESDLCPKTPLGVKVNKNGCPIITLISDRFKVETTNETCFENNNGQVNIVALRQDQYIASFQNKEYAFSSSLIIDHVAPGEHELCIRNASSTYDGCRTVFISKGMKLEAVESFKEDAIVFSITSGTAPYTLYKNGESVLQSQESIFRHKVKQGDRLEVRSSIDCEGKWYKTISAFDGNEWYPNPTEDILNVDLPFALNALVDVKIYSTELSLLHSDQFKATSKSWKIDLANYAAGQYYVHLIVNGEKTVFNVIKK